MAMVTGLGCQTAARMMAKELVRLRAAKTKLQGMSSHMGAMGVRATVRTDPGFLFDMKPLCVCLRGSLVWLRCAQTMAATVTMNEAIGGAASAMAASNASVNPQAMARTMQQFAQQTELMNMTEDMMDDALADAVRYGMLLCLAVPWLVSTHALVMQRLDLFGLQRN